MNRVKHMVGAGKVYEQGFYGEGIRVALLDTGVYPHPDLSGRICFFHDFTGRYGERMSDRSGHGTHIAGIVCGDGSSSNGRITGMAPLAELIVLKVLDDAGNGQTGQVLDAIRWLMEYHREYGIRVVNFSIGFLPESGKREQELIQEGLELLWEDGVVIVVAAGNNGPGLGSVTVPGSSEKLITVGASDDHVFNQSVPRNYSGRGPTGRCVVKPEIYAPGTNIVSLGNSANRYETKSGTSMATPVVSGAIALKLQKCPQLRPEEIKLQLYQMTRNQNWRRGGWGVLQVDKFMDIV